MDAGATCEQRCQRSLVPCKTQVQMLNLSVKLEGLRHSLCWEETQADFREPRWVCFCSCSLEDATMFSYFIQGEEYVPGLFPSLEISFY